MTYKSLLLHSAADLTKNIWEINETISQIFCFISQFVLTIPQFVVLNLERSATNCLNELYHSNASATKLDVLVVEAHNARSRAEVLAYNLAQGACASTMENAHAGLSHLNSIVNEISHRSQCLIYAHAAQVNVLLEVKLLFLHRITRLLAHKGGSLHGVVLLGFFGKFQTVDGEGSVHTSEEHLDIFALHTFYATHSRLSLDAHILSRFKVEFWSGRTKRLLLLCCR